MSSALMRGRTLDPAAVAQAKRDRAKKTAELMRKREQGKLTVKDRKWLLRVVGWEAHQDPYR